jgi:hypothetical protein
VIMRAWFSFWRWTSRVLFKMDLSDVELDDLAAVIDAEAARMGLI